MVYDTSVRALFLWDQFHYGSLHIIIETVGEGEQRPCSRTQSVMSLVGIGNAMQTVETELYLSTTKRTYKVDFIRGCDDVPRTKDNNVSQWNQGMR